MAQSQGEAARIRSDHKKGVGGAKRRRSGSSMNPWKPPSLVIPREFLDGCDGFRFPATSATSAQVKALGLLLADFVQNLPIGLLAGLSVEVVAKGVGLSAPTVRKRRLLNLPLTQDLAELSLTAQVLVRMDRGDLAGALGYGPLADAMWLWKAMAFPPAEDFRSHVARLSRDHDRDLWPLYCAFRLDHLDLITHREGSARGDRPGR